MLPLDSLKSESHREQVKFDGEFDPGKVALELASPRRRGTLAFAAFPFERPWSAASPRWRLRADAFGFILGGAPTAEHYSFAAPARAKLNTTSRRRARPASVDGVLTCSRMLKPRLLTRT